MLSIGVGGPGPRRWATAVSLLAVCGCAGISPMSPRPEAKLEMPSGWDWAWLERLDRGKASKMTVAVLDFRRNDGIPRDLDLKLEDMLITALAKTGKFNLVERDRLDRVAQEQKRALEEIFPGGLGSMPVIDPHTAPKLGKLLGTQAVVFGTVTSATSDTVDRFTHELQRFEVVVDVRAVDLTSGVIFLSEMASGRFEVKRFVTADGTLLMGPKRPEAFRAGYVSAVRAAVAAIAVKVAEHYPLVGYVLDVRNRVVYLDLGESRGVRKGEQFIVFRRGEEIRHPVGNGHVGWEKEIIGAVSVASPEMQMSVAQLDRLKDPALPIRPGDLAISVTRAQR
jgi:curli biogenesis system outer membrane secretion channel CsgG